MKKLIVIIVLLAMPFVVMAAVKPVPNLTDPLKDKLIDAWIQNGEDRAQLFSELRRGVLTPERYNEIVDLAYKRWFLQTSVAGYIVLADILGIDKTTITLQDIADTQAQYKIDLGIEE